MDDLIDKAQQVLKTRRRSEGVIPPFEFVDREPSAAWRAQAQHALTSLLGEQSNYTQAFTTQVQASSRAQYVDVGLGILKAVRDDAAQGHLFITAGGLISAEIFSDFLEMAEHLLDNHYVPVAASLTGAVLEDALRRIADSHAISHNKHDGLASLNDKCVKAGMYNAIVQREIQLWTGIRNSADHGNFGDFTEVQVQDMHRGVSRFLAEQL